MVMQWAKPLPTNTGTCVGMPAEVPAVVFPVQLILRCLGEQQMAHVHELLGLAQLTCCSSTGE